MYHQRALSELSQNPSSARSAVKGAPLPRSGRQWRVIVEISGTVIYLRAVQFFQPGNCCWGDGEEYP